MKKILLGMILLLTTLVSYSQQTDSLKLSSSEAYLVKSQHQKTGAWVLTAAGATGLIVTTLSALSNAAKSVFGLTVLVGGPQPHSYTVPYVLSAAGIAGGIVLFIAASKNRRTANGVSFNFKMEHATVLQPFGITQQYYPCMAVKIKLK